MKYLYSDNASNESSSMMFLFVYIYSALVLIRPHEYLPQLKDVPILPFILIMGAIIWIVYGRKSFHISQNKLIIIFLVILSLSPLFQGWPGGISIAFTKFYPIAIFYLILVSALDTSKRITKFYWLMCVAAVIFAVHGIDQTNNGVGWTGVSPVMDGRITYVGIFNDPNDLGNYFVATLPIIIYLFSASRSYLSRLTLSLSMGFVLYGIYLTNSRGAVLGVAGMLWVYLASKYGFIKAILVSMLFSPLFLFGPSRITEIHPTEESAAGRVDAWYAGLEMLKNSGFLGVGYGGFVEHHHLTAHNSFVLVFSELGVVGYFVWLSFLFLTLMMAYKMLSGSLSKEKEMRTDGDKLAYPIFYSLIGFCVTAFFLSRSYNIILYLLSALSVANYINNTKHANILLTNYFWTIVFLTIGSILFFFIIVKVLLNI